MALKDNSPNKFVNALFGRAQLRREQEAANQDFQQQYEDYFGGKISNPYAGVKNPYEDMENVYEEIFSLKHHGGWSFVEAYSLPISLRRWFLKRLIRQFEDERKQIEKDAFSWHKKTKGRAYEKYNYRKIIQESSER